MKVPLVDLKKQYEDLRQDIEQPLLHFLRDQYFILGPTVESLEEEIADYCGVAHGVGVSSGTDALLVALMALGVGPGDEVVTSAYTFFATAGSIHRTGAKPVFADIDPETFNICPRSLEAALTERAKAIVPVHLYGQCVDLQPVLAIAEARGLPVIEDAAQALGAKWEGREAGSIGLAGCLSFFPTKNLGGFGDGGMIVTGDQAFADKARLLRNHGAESRYYHRMVGGNFRLDALQALVLSKKLPYLEGWLQARRNAAQRYDRLFSESGLVESGKATLPRELVGRHTFNQYVVRVPDRDKLQEFLSGRGIATSIYYPVPLHLQECFAELGYQKGSLPESERAAEETLALPICPAIEEEAQEYVVKTIEEFYG